MMNSCMSKQPQGKFDMISEYLASDPSLDTTSGNPIPPNNKRTVSGKLRARALSKDFQDMLDAALSTPKKRQIAIKEAEKQFAGEMFRFYCAIAEWEKEARVKNSSNSKRTKMAAYKLIATFVEPGSMYENGCISSETRQILLKRQNISDWKTFETCKYEVANDICMNPTLRAIVEKCAAGDHAPVL